MEFTITPVYLICFAVGILLGAIGARVLIKRAEGKEGFLAKVFQSNKDLDTTLGVIIAGVIIFTMIMHFQDHLKSEAGYIIQGAMNGFFYLLGFKQGAKEDANGNRPKP